MNVARRVGTVVCVLLSVGALAEHPVQRLESRAEVQRMIRAAESAGHRGDVARAWADMKPPARSLLREMSEAGGRDGCQALRWLGYTADADVGAYLHGRLKSRAPPESGTTRLRIIEALGNLSCREAEDSLLTILQSPQSHQEKEAVVRALGCLGGQKAAKSLSALMTNVLDEPFRSEVEYSVRRIEGYTEETKADLSTPKAAVRAFIQSIRQHDLVAYREVLSRELKDTKSDEEIRAEVFANDVLRAAMDVIEKTLPTLEAHVEGDRAYMWYDANRRVDVIKEWGAWRIANVN